MNTINSDKSLTLSGGHKELQQKKEPISSVGDEKTRRSVTSNSATQDNVNLSASGQLLNQSAISELEPSRSILEIAEQASTLLSKLRQQFEQSGLTALTAHSSVRPDQMEMLLRSASA